MVEKWRVFIKREGNITRVSKLKQTRVVQIFKAFSHKKPSNKTTSLSSRDVSTLVNPLLLCVDASLCAVRARHEGQVAQEADAKVEAQAQEDA
ncbi:hypothetical protein MRX96_059806 [Rhipicephalus microplus]